MINIVRGFLAKIRGIFLSMSKTVSRKGLYSFLQGEINQIRFGAQVLSIGAGGEVNNQLLKASITKGYEVTQLDIDAARTPDIIADICKWQPDKHYDVIFMSEVLEHLHSPHLAIENVFNALKEGGRLIITVPFMFPIHDRPHDYFRYTKYGLCWLLQDFTEVRIQEKNNWLQALCVILVRTIKFEGRLIHFFSPGLVTLGYLLYPIATGIGKLIPVDAFTTGYFVAACK